jgi:predicted transcriptional regulator
MAASTTLTVRLPKKVKDRLGKLARHTRRTRSYLASEAITSFVEREIEIVEGIHRSLEDVRAGRVVPHDEVARGIDAIIAAAERNKKRR